MKKLIISIMTLVFVITLFGCKEQDTNSTIKGFTKAMQEFDIEAMAKYVANSEEQEIFFGGDDLPEAMIKYVKDSLKKMTYTISKTEVNGDEATVTVIYNHVDAYDLMEKAMEDYVKKAFEFIDQGTDPTEAEYMQMFSDAFEDAVKNVETTMVDTTVTYNLVKQDTDWKIDISDDTVFSNILYSYMDEALNYDGE